MYALSQSAISPRMCWRVILVCYILNIIYICIFTNLFNIALFCNYQCFCSLSRQYFSPRKNNSLQQFFSLSLSPAHWYYLLLLCFGIFFSTRTIFSRPLKLNGNGTTSNPAALLCNPLFPFWLLPLETDILAKTKEKVFSLPSTFPMQGRSAYQKVLQNCTSYLNNFKNILLLLSN